MYVWRLENGNIAGDDEGNVMNVFCLKGDQSAIRAITDAARHYGFGPGYAEWQSGKRRITDEELAEQEMRASLGLIPDPMDYAAIRDEEKIRHRDRK
jgi:hypothetical protein